MSKCVIKGRLIDGTGAAPVEAGVVVLDGNKITAVGDEQSVKPAPGLPVVKIEDGTVLPGLIEQHCHIAGLGSVNPLDWYTTSVPAATCQAVADCAALLDAGFTSARDVGGFGNLMRGSIEKGVIRGPRLSSSGKVMTQTGGHGDLFQSLPVSLAKDLGMAHIVDGVEDCRLAARMEFRAGANFLKIMTTGGITSQGDVNTHCQYHMDEIKVLVQEAKHHDSYVASHAQGTQGIKNALLGGVISIEHGIFLDDECIELMLKIGAYLVPTFSIAHMYMENLDTIPPWIVPKIKSSYEAHYESVRKAHAAGVKIGLGADFLGDPAMCPYGKNGMEFERLTAAGLSPMDAIVSATKIGSELMLMPDQIGTLETDKLADVIVVSGNPLEDISILGNPDNIKVVIKDGKTEKDIR
ncbi:MAG: amidohydrolase family protein [Deltaproteobacteria bacterium]|nr:amidohydrolase family protein [Deltaproteobacteria bacterium]